MHKRRASRRRHNDGVFGLMNKPIGCLCLMFIRPIQHPAEVSTFMWSVEIGDRMIFVIMPFVRDYTHIRVAHDFLAEHIGAMVLMDTVVSIVF